MRKGSHGNVVSLPCKKSRPGPTRLTERSPTGHAFPDDISVSKIVVLLSVLE